GRIGGDEFAVLIKDYGTVELIATKAQEICDGFRKKNFLADDPKTIVPTSASIGIALYEEDGKTFDELYKCADIVLYRSKESGRDRYTFAEHTAADNGLSKKVD
ncbi:MAG: GGDEF domain-containing protein, partial [Angelakisella sp.]